MNAAHLLPLRPLRDFIASPSDRAALALFSLFFFSFSRESANGVCVCEREDLLERFREREGGKDEEGRKRVGKAVGRGALEKSAPGSMQGR